MVSARPSGFQPASGYVGEGVEKLVANTELWVYGQLQGVPDNLKHFRR